MDKNKLPEWIKNEFIPMDKSQKFYFDDSLSERALVYIFIYMGDKIGRQNKQKCSKNCDCTDFGADLAPIILLLCYWLYRDRCLQYTLGL